MSLFYKDRSASDDGIEEVYINGNMIVGDKLLVNASLIPFEQIMQRAEECFFQLYHFMGHDAGNGADKRVIHIDRIKLGYMQVAAQNSRGQNLIPVWDFFVWEEVLHYDTSEPVTINRQNSYFTINAIDASIPDRTQGY